MKWVEREEQTIWKLHSARPKSDSNLKSAKIETNDQSLCN